MYLVLAKLIHVINSQSGIIGEKLSMFEMVNFIRNRQAKANVVICMRLAQEYEDLHE